MSSLKGLFDSYHLYFNQGKDGIVIITIKDRLYIITNIANGYKEKAFSLVDTTNMSG